MHCTYGIRGFIVLEQIDQEIRLNKYLIVQILAHMVSMVVGDEPADTLFLFVGKSSETCEQLKGDSRPLLFLKLSVLITILLLARPDANVMHKGGTF